MIMKCISGAIQNWSSHSPSTERHWTAEPERFHSAEVSDEQVGLQQLQLGGQLASTLHGSTPTPLARGSWKQRWCGGCFITPSAKKKVNSFLLQRFPPTPSLGPALLQFLLRSEEALRRENAGAVTMLEVGGRDRRPWKGSESES